MSPRNSPEAVMNLLEKTGSRRLLIQEATLPLANSVKELLTSKNYDISFEYLVPLHELFPGVSSEPVHHQNGMTHVEPYPPAPTPSHPSDVVCIMHSSGSTGLPKPVSHTHRTWHEWSLCGTLPLPRVPSHLAILTSLTLI